MKVLILLALFTLLVSSAPKGKGSRARIAAPVSNSEIVLECTLGTPLGESLKTALETCNQEEDDRVAQTSGKGKGKGKAGKGKSGKGKEKGKSGSGKGGKSCPTVGDVLKRLRSKAKKDICVFASIGWVGNDGEVIEDAMREAIKTLPADVTFQMSLNKIETCAKSKAKEWAERPKRKRCDATYAVNERERLHKYEATVAGMKCVKSLMSTACRTFLDKVTGQNTDDYDYDYEYEEYDDYEEYNYDDYEEYNYDDYQYGNYDYIDNRDDAVNNNDGSSETTQTEEPAADYYGGDYNGEQDYVDDAENNNDGSTETTQAEEPPAAVRVPQLLAVN